jgi:hypothetical protein
MAEARRLKNGRWRLYKSPGLLPVRDPDTGGGLSFDSLAEARNWWRREHPGEPAPQEAIKCAKCGAYFARSSTWTLAGGLYYHLAHAPEFARRRRQG